MKQKGVVVVLVVAALVAVGLLFNRTTRQTSQRSSNTYTLKLVDVEANKVFLQEFSMDEFVSLPMQSPFSSGKNAYLVYKCSKDGTIFAFEESRGDETGPPVPSAPRCPVCGSSDYLVEPELPEGQKSMDIPGPVTIVR